MELPIYLVVKETGLFNQNNEELVIVYDVKLTRSAAEGVALVNPGTKVIKRIADKDAP